MTRIPGGPLLLLSTLLFMGLAQPVRADDRAYRRTEALAFTCFTCHGTDGRSPGAIPSLCGKTADFIIRRMHEFRSGKREATIMNRISKAYSDEEIARIARYIAQQDEGGHK